MALERGRGRTSVPVRTTIGGAIVGLGAMVASLIFAASLSHLLGSPPLYGVTGDTEIWNNDGPGAVPAAGPVVRADPDITTAAFIQTGIDFRLEGRVLPGFAYTPVKGTFAASMLTGRVPAAADEAALGASTAAQLGVRPGSTLLGSAENEEAPQVPVRIVGTAVLPPGDVSAHLGDGVIVSHQALVRLAGGRVRSPYVIAVTFRPGVDTARGVARLDRRLAAVDGNFFTQPPTTPTDLVNFGRIQNLPLILASVLAVLALITVAHLLATSIRRRRRDLAILKTLGFTHGEVGRTVAWQATTLAAVTLAVGVPLGIAAADRLAPFRRAPRSDSRGVHTRRAAGAGRAGRHPAGQPHLDRAGRIGHANPPGLGAAPGVTLPATHLATLRIVWALSGSGGELTTTRPGRGNAGHSRARGGRDGSASGGTASATPGRSGRRCLSRAFRHSVLGVLGGGRNQDRG